MQKAQKVTGAPRVGTVCGHGVAEEESRVDTVLCVPRDVQAVLAEFCL